MATEPSPLRHGPGLSALADRDELEFRESSERYDDPASEIPRFIERKDLPRKLSYALERAGLEPAGTIVDLGAGTCWLSALLASRPAVERVIAIDFSERRLRRLAPVAIAYLGAPPEKIERVVADFYDHGVEPGIADWVFMDAAFHHAAEPVRLARVAFDLLRRGGTFVLFREPSLSLLRRSRDHGEEDEHGSFEREYTPREYLGHLSAAGFEVEKHAASGGFATPRARALLKPPLAWLNGIAFSEYTYVGRKH
jgi:SAM-dependent methyltransferase